jgi:glycosyltransferase involved in cell wall biosynthesis
MNNFLDFHKKNRVVNGKIKMRSNQITIFIGLYNANEYLDGILAQIIKQVNQNFYLIIADNNSNDDTWERIQEWMKYFEGRIMLVRNKINVGGSGNLIINMDLIKTSWFCSFHQDDFYKNNHIQYLIKNIDFKDSNLAAVTTDMGSIDNNGNVSARRMRAGWLVKNNGQVEAFVSNLFVHNGYWPSTAFNLSIFKKAAKNSLWHSSTFPDTEILLKICAYGKIKRVNKETMLYRENDASESRSINPTENLYGVFTALLRVFGSKEFKSVSKMVTEKKRAQFLQYICEGISIRLDNEELTNIVVFIVTERLVEIWGYNNSHNLNLLIKFYTELNSNHSVSILRNILSLGLDNSHEYELFEKKTMKLPYEVYKLKNNRKIIGRPIYNLYQTIGIYLPYAFAKTSLTALYKLKISVTKKHPWKFYNFRNK